jgi:hypothetical protein
VERIKLNERALFGTKSALATNPHREAIEHCVRDDDRVDTVDRDSGNPLAGLRLVLGNLVRMPWRSRGSQGACSRQPC